MQQASDDIEYKYGYRPEGTLAVGIVSTIVYTIMTPLNAVYEIVAKEITEYPLIKMSRSNKNAIT